MMVQQMTLGAAMVATTTTTTTTDKTLTPKSRPASSVKAQRQTVAEKRIERGGVMVPRVAVVPHFDLPPRTTKCQCGRCGVVYSSLSAFDSHQTLDDSGDVQCWEPASIGMVEREGVWGRPGDPSRFEKDGGDDA